MTDKQSQSIARTICALCGTPVEVDSIGGDLRCAACFDQYLRELDADFLDHYARMGARGHLVVAEACLRSLVLSDSRDRPLLAMTVYERFVAAATDFLGLYQALVNRRDAPIMQSVLEVKLEPAAAIKFFADLASSGPIEMLAAIGLPIPEQVEHSAPLLDRKERRQVADALRDATADFQNLAAYRDVGEEALLAASQCLRGPVTVTEKTRWLAGREVDAAQIASLDLRSAEKTVELNLLSADEETLNAVVNGIEIITRLSRNLIFAFVSVHPPKRFRNHFEGD